MIYSAKADSYNKMFLVACSQFYVENYFYFMIQFTHNQGLFWKITLGGDT